MTRSWIDDKRWADPYLPFVKAICGYYFLAEGTYVEDAQQNTDLKVLDMGDIRIAVRLRESQYWREQTRNGHPYRQDFTLRNSRPNGTPTEFDKILDGFGDYFFYGFACAKPPRLLGFGILNLQCFRGYCQQYHATEGIWPGRIRKNDDGTTFRVLQWASLPKESIVGTWPHDIAHGQNLMPEEARESIGTAIQMALGF